MSHAHQSLTNISEPNTTLDCDFTTATEAAKTFNKLTKQPTSGDPFFLNVNTKCQSSKWRLVSCVLRAPLCSIQPPQSAFIYRWSHTLSCPPYLSAKSARKSSFKNLFLLNPTSLEKNKNKIVERKSNAPFVIWISAKYLFCARVFFFKCSL